MVKEFETQFIDIIQRTHDIKSFRFAVPEDIDFYDKGHVHMLMFSDALTDGIVKQFPDKFKK